MRLILTFLSLFILASSPFGAMKYGAPIGPPMPAAAVLPFIGPGLNTHGQLLPVPKLRAIGIRWVRGDLPPAEITENRVKAFLAHYAGMPVLWILPQQTPDALAVARKLRAWGVRDIECGNEPDLDLFNEGRRPWTGKEYGLWFASVKAAVPTGVRLYGPATGTWNVKFIRDAIANGMKPAAISFHGYWKNVPDLEPIYYECKGRFGLQAICTEIGFGGFTRTAQGYPHPTEPADGYIMLMRLVGNLPFCFYDGPNANEDKTMGLFNWDGMSWNKTTPTYDQILESIRALAIPISEIRSRFALL